MTLLIDVDALRTRADVAHGALATLAASLRRDLQPLVDAPVQIPAQKALLSRDGGRCPTDGAMLTFDPASPRDHRCPACGTIVRGERHDRWWATWQHLWLAERSVHAATLYAMHGERALAQLAATILSGYAERYLNYPNRDNALGPTRPFFSTYLESIWLAQLCIAIDLLELAGAPDAPGGLLRDALVAPSAELIASFDEGASNRQVWNNAAMLAAGRLLDDEALVDRAIHGPTGLQWHLETALLPDGTWYEGDNYHLFAHRGLSYGVTMAECAGVPLPQRLRERFQEGFAAPLLTALPDFTFPSRRDSPHRVSLRQWRFAESCELGLARHPDPRLLGALHTLYHTNAARRDTGRWRSTAEAERNEPAAALSRADLGWRSLLFACAELPPLAPARAGSALLEGQGIAVIRRNEGQTYVALDYGHAGGGHGHPDRLNLLLAVGDDRWLDDVGTGSYVDPTLHWYRSTLAHNAPLVNGHSQASGDGVLRAWDDRGAAGWVRADLPEGRLAPGTSVTRTVVVMDDYALDRVEWTASQEVRFELPLHIDATMQPPRAWRDAALVGGESASDGFSFVRTARRAEAAAGEVVHLARAAGGDAWMSSTVPCTWWRAVGPAPPGADHDERAFFVVRQRGTSGTITCVWSWAGAVRAVEIDPAGVHVTMRDGSRQQHAPSGDAEWRVGFVNGHARSSLVLDRGRPPLPMRAAPPAPTALVPEIVPRHDAPPLTTQLGRDAYRWSEETWEQAGRPTAVVRVAAPGEALEIDVHVRKMPVHFRGADAPDPEFDNEHPDIHSDGVQLYLDAGGWTAPVGVLAIPDPSHGGVRLRRIEGSRLDVPVSATWARRADGYAMHFAVPLRALGDPTRDIACALDVLVNEIPPGRERRRGQLVMSGGKGESVYLRGDRQPRARFRHFVIPRA